MIKLGIDIDNASDYEELPDAEIGLLDPLARLIEEGGELGPKTRKWLAAYLRGEIKFKPGNKRLQSQVNKERKVVRMVRELQYHSGRFYQATRKLSQKEIKKLSKNKEEMDRFLEDTRGQIKENAAIDLYCDLVKGAEPRETVRTYMRKAKEMERLRGW